MKLSKYFILFLLFGSLLCMTGWSADVYVNATTGSDANNGLAAGTAKATMGAAIVVLNGQAAGSVLHVQGSTIYTEGAATGATFQITAAGVSIVSDPVGSTLQDMVLEVINTNVTIQDLAFNARTIHENCIVIRSGAANCTVTGCEFTGVASVVGEHFNTETADGSEDDVAPILVTGAQDASIVSCVFNPAETWQWSILMPNASGPGFNLTIDSCVINGATLTGGLRLQRVSHNLQILDTDFIDMSVPAVYLDFGTSTVASGTMVGMLLDGCNINGFLGGNTVDGAVQILNCTVENLTFSNTRIFNIGLSGAEGLSLLGGEVKNATFVNYTHDVSPDTGNGNMFAIGSRGGTNVLGDAAANVPSWWGTLLVDNCTFLRGGAFQLAANAERCIVENLVIRDSTFVKTIGEPGVNGFYMNWTHMRKMDIDNLYMDWRGGNDAIAMWGVNSLFENITIGNSTVMGRTDGFVIANTTGSNILIHDSYISGGAHAIVSRRDGGVIDNITVINSQLDNTAVDGFQDGWGASFCARIGNAQISNVTLDNITFTGFRAWGMYDIGLKANMTVSNCRANTTSHGIYTGVGCVLQNVIFDNCDFVSDTYAWFNWQNLTTFGPTVISDVTATDCYFGGGIHGMRNDQQTEFHGFWANNCTFEASGTSTGSGSLGIKNEAGSTMEDSHFSGCEFIYSGTLDDATNLRVAGFLCEDPGTGLTDCTFADCTFTGGNCGFALQRYTITSGETVQPIMNNVSFTNTTCRDQLDRGISLQYSGGGNVSFDGLTITGLQGGHGVYAQWNGDNLTFSDVTIDGNSLGGGFVFGTALGGTASDWEVDGATITNTVVTPVYVFNAVQNCTINNVWVSSVTHALMVDNYSEAPGTQAQNIAFTGCEVQGAGGDGVYLSGSGHTVQGCTITNVAGSGVYINDYSALRAAPSNITVVSNTINNAAANGIFVEGFNHTVGWNTINLANSGIVLRSGLSGLLAGESSTFDNTIIRNSITGGVGSATGIYEGVNPRIFELLGTEDPLLHDITYLNNTVTDWTNGTEFRGRDNRIQNNIIAFNSGNGLVIQNPGLKNLEDGFNGVYGNGTDYAGVTGPIFASDIRLDPLFLSRDPANANYYILTNSTSPCLDAGTTDGSTGDTVTDLGSKESGTSEVASWRLY
jgi:Right handed beta helix region